MKLQPNAPEASPRTTSAFAAHPFLSGMSQAHIDFLARLATDRIFASGDFLCREGMPADAFHLLHAGRVSLEVHVLTQSGVRIATLHAGDVLGWSWLIAPHRWRLDARALEPVRAFTIDAAILRRLCEEDHDLGYALLSRLSSVIAQRLHATRLQLLDAHARVKAGAHREVP